MDASSRNRRTFDAEGGDTLVDCVQSILCCHQHNLLSDTQLITVLPICTSLPLLMVSLGLSMIWGQLRTWERRWSGRKSNGQP